MSLEIQTTALYDAAKNVDFLEDSFCSNPKEFWGGTYCSTYFFLQYFYRSEAFYAQYCRKEIIPVITQQGHVRTGWPGFLTAGKLYYEMFDSEKLKGNFPSIL